MIEQEKSPKEILVALREGIIPAVRPLFEELGVEEILDDAIRFRKITNLTPWADTDLPQEANEICRKHTRGEWPIFLSALRLVELVTPTQPYL